jgi:hypothetical protein
MSSLSKVCDFGCVEAAIHGRQLRVDSGNWTATRDNRPRAAINRLDDHRRKADCQNLDSVEWLGYASLCYVICHETDG